MKKIVLLLVTSLIMTTGFSQSSKVQSCINYLKSEKYDKAKKAIDTAVLHNKTKDNAKAWWYHGQTYQLIWSQCKDKNLQEYCDLSPDALDIALNSFVKAINLNWKDPKWATLDIMNNEADFQVFARLAGDRKNIDNWDITYDIMYSRMNSLSINFFNEAVNQLNSDDIAANKKSIELFDKSIRLSSLTKFDTLAYFYSALGAEKSKMWDVAVERFGRIIEMDYGKDDKSKVLNYSSLAKAYIELGDSANYVATLAKGAELYSNTSSMLMDMLINYYLSNNQKDEALAYLNQAIEKNPTNETYYYAKGTLLDEIGDYAQAEPAYLKAIEIKPDYYDAIYNLGVLYNNQAVEVFGKARDLPIEQQKKYDKMMDEGKELLKKALPYMEKTHELQPDDINPVISLKGIYYTLGMYDKSNEMKDIIDAYEKK